MKTNKINESLQMDMTTYKKIKGTLDPKTPVTITGDKPATTTGSVTEENDIIEPEAVIAPQDNATIKYLSNVRDSKTGKISQPFTIGAQKYQMVRGMCDNQIVMAVFAHDETDDNGENIIYPVDIFEKNIVQPMMEKEIMFGNEIEIVKEVKPEPKPEPKGMDSLNLSEFKHYLVNEKTGKFRKFKNIVELAAAVMAKEEKYMPLKEFRKFFDERVFGGKPKRNGEVINELIADAPAPSAAPEQPTAAAPEDDDATLLSKAKRLVKSMDEVPRVDKSLDYLANSKNYKEKTQALNAFLQRINIRPGDVPKYLATVKDVGKDLKQNTGAPAATGAAPLPPENELAPLNEKKVMTKAELTESLLKPKVIKTIKVKDIK
jgi:hypothetical protein